MPNDPRRMQWPIQADRDRYYGNPRGDKQGRPSAQWEAANIVRVEIPWRAVLAWDTDTVVKSIRIHRLCASSLRRVLETILASAHLEARQGRIDHQKVIEQWGMHLYGGAYEFRQVRGGTSLSSHSWGCAIDWNPKDNGLGDSTPDFALPTHQPVRRAFEIEGWTWGGDWRRPDGMHWQAARVS